MYGPGVVMTFEEAALAYANDGGEARYLVKISEQLAGMTLYRITPQVVRAAAKKAFKKGTAPSTINRQGIVPARAVINYAHSEGWCAPIKVKMFEETKRGTMKEVKEYFEEKKPKGEFVIIVEGK